MPSSSLSYILKLISHDKDQYFFYGCNTNVFHWIIDIFVVHINLNFIHCRSTSRIANALAYICGLLIGICPDCKCISSLNNRDLAKEYRLPWFTLHLMIRTQALDHTWSQCNIHKLKSHSIPCYSFETRWDRLKLGVELAMFFNQVLLCVSIYSCDLYIFLIFDWMFSPTTTRT